VLAMVKGSYVYTDMGIFQKSGYKACYISDDDISHALARTFNCL